MCDEFSIRPRARFGPPPRPMDVRLWAKVDKTPTCWLWTGGVAGKGYGKLRQGGRDVYTHRLSWFLAFGPIPEGQAVLHRCDTPRCVRPDHLFLGSIAENNADMYAKGRHVHGERTPHAKLTSDQVIEVRRLAAQGMSQRQIASQFGIGQQGVSKIVSGLRWKHVA